MTNYFNLVCRVILVGKVLGSFLQIAYAFSLLHYTDFYTVCVSLKQAFTEEAPSYLGNGEIKFAGHGGDVRHFGALN